MTTVAHHMPGTNPVSSIMTRDFAVVRDSVNVHELTKFLLERRITCAAVSDACGKLVGYVSMTDLVRERFMNGETENYAPSRKRTARSYSDGFHLESVPRATVRDIMMPFVFRVPENAPIDHAAALMAREGVHRVLIVSEANEVVGIVSALDILRWLAKQDGYVVRESRNARWRHSCEYVT
jgi:CBS domain-containing protein